MLRQLTAFDEHGDTPFTSGFSASPTDLSSHRDYRIIESPEVPVNHPGPGDIMPVLRETRRLLGVMVGVTANIEATYRSICESFRVEVVEAGGRR